MATVSSSTASRKVEQEQDVHEGDHHRLPERLRGAADEARAVVERHDANAPGETGLERPDLLVPRQNQIRR
jgi:hypothetical protein